ncbi:Bd3614 family nucleic acid deaminase [Bdellovibrionota bacterium FG-1]
MIQEIAWLEDGDWRYFATCPWPRPVADSAVVRLIEGIWEQKPEHARRILRRKIFTTAPHLGEIDFGAVKVAAKRIAWGLAPPSPWPGHWIELKPSLDTSGWVDLATIPSFAADRTPADYMQLARDLAARVQIQSAKYLSDRRIAALLVSPEGKLLSAAFNSSAQNRIRHAEVNLIRGYCGATQRSLAAGTQLYTTLKCCKMCAGMIWDAASNPMHLTVFYDEEDSGPMGRSTVLTPQSFERRRATRGQEPFWVQKVLERRISDLGLPAGPCWR